MKNTAFDAPYRIVLDFLYWQTWRPGEHFPKWKRHMEDLFVEQILSTCDCSLCGASLHGR
jgi:hypothetical protein